MHLNKTYENGEETYDYADENATVSLQQETGSDRPIDYTGLNETTSEVDHASNTESYSNLLDNRSRAVFPLYITIENDIVQSNDTENDHDEQISLPMLNYVNAGECHAAKSSTSIT